MKNSKKDRQKVLQRYSIFMNEFKLLAEFDPNEKDWTFETKELIDYLCYNWNTFCFDNGYFAHGKVLLVEINVIKAMFNPENEGKENELRIKINKAHDYVKNK